MSLDTRLAGFGLSEAEFAARIGVTPEAVRLWRHGKRRMRADRALAIEREFGIPRQELRPDLWPPVAAEAA